IRDYKVTGVQTCALPIYLTNGGKWSGAWMQPNLIIDTSEKYAGNKSLQMKLEVSTSEVANALQKLIQPNQDTLYMRAYTKFASRSEERRVGKEGTMLHCA